MERIVFEVYEDANGDSPFYEWAEALPKKDRAKLFAVIDRVQQFGLPEAARQQWVKHLDGPIWEIRSQFAGNIQRACYFHVMANRYVITHGFTKKTQKTPHGEIDRAMRIYRLLAQKGE